MADSRQIVTETRSPHLGDYQATVRGLSDRIVEAQRPIRILDAIKWDDSIERAFFAAGSRELPPVTADFYRSRPLPFDPSSKRDEFLGIERDIRKHLGRFNAPGQIMTRMCEEYRAVIDMLEARGTRRFSELSEMLYGSASDRFHAGDPNLADLGRGMAGALDAIHPTTAGKLSEPPLDAKEAVEVLARQLQAYFGETGPVRVKLSDGIIADAAAGADYIKLRTEAVFTRRELRLLEVHEGWVHLGTTVNGQRQPVCTFLSKGPPSSTITQEGLAMLTEVLAFASHPARLRRLTNRVRAITMAEEGASFLDVYRFFLDQCDSPFESYQQSVRVFRGSLPEKAGPFTKDLCYSRGFVQIASYLRLAAERGQMRAVPLLFSGKTALADIKTLTQLVEEGLVEPPRHVPPPFADLHALAAWLCCANFLDRLSPRRIQDDYAGLF